VISDNSYLSAWKLERKKTLHILTYLITYDGHRHVYKSSSVAEMGDRLATIGMGRKWGGAAVGVWVPTGLLIWPSCRAAVAVASWRRFLHLHHHVRYSALQSKPTTNDHTACQLAIPTNVKIKQHSLIGTDWLIVHRLFYDVNIKTCLCVHSVLLHLFHVRSKLTLFQRPSGKKR